MIKEYPVFCFSKTNNQFPEEPDLFSWCEILDRERDPEMGFDRSQALSFESGKLGRRLIRDLTRVFSNKNGMGLYSYAVFLSLAITNGMRTKRVKGKKYLESGEYGHAYVYENSDRFPALLGKRVFGKRGDPNGGKTVADDLAHLQRMGLVDVKEYKNKILVTLSHRSASYDRLGAKREFAVVRSGSGFVMLRKYEVNRFFESNIRTVSECDAIVDLLAHIVYNDDSLPYTENCPIVMMNDKTRDYHTTVRYLAARWNRSVGWVCALLKKMVRSGYFRVHRVPNRGLYITAPIYIQTICPERQMNDHPYRFYCEAFGKNAERIYNKELSRVREEKVEEILRTKKENVYPIRSFVEKRNCGMFLFWCSFLTLFVGLSNLYTPLFLSGFLLCFFCFIPCICIASLCTAKKKERFGIERRTKTL